MVEIAIIMFLAVVGFNGIDNAKSGGVETHQAK